MPSHSRPKVSRPATTIIRLAWVKFTDAPIGPSAGCRLELAQCVDRSSGRHYRPPSWTFGPRVGRGANMRQTLSTQPRRPAGRTPRSGWVWCRTGSPARSRWRPPRPGPRPARSPPAGRSPRGSCRRCRRNPGPTRRRGVEPLPAAGGFQPLLEGGRLASSPGSSLMSAPGRLPRRKAGACYRGVWTVSRMQPARRGGISGPLRRRHGARGGFVRDHRRDHVAAVGLHR